MQRIKIFDKLVGEGESCFIVAEAGSNHNGSLEIGKELIEKAKEAGADAVKFQAFSTGELVTQKAEKAPYQEGKSYGKTQFEMLKALELSKGQHKELVQHAKKIGIPLFYSVFDKKSVSMVEKIGAGKVFKLGSGEITNIPLIKYIAKKEKPVILSTGISTLSEIKEVIEALGKNKSKAVLMHCVTGYPSKIEDSNLGAIETLKKEFDVPVGHSDHTHGIIVSVAAAVLGACMIEKHFTLDKKMPGPDHKMSMDPMEFKLMVSGIKKIESFGKIEKEKLAEALEKIEGINVRGGELRSIVKIIIGHGNKIPQENEKKELAWVRKSIVARINIKKGTKICASMLAIKRPGTGMQPKFYSKVVGKTAKIDIKKDTLIKWSMLR